jgi:hypothetical protein
VRQFHTQVVPPYVFHNSPRPGSIGVVCGPWSAERTVVHRVYARYLVALARVYDLTLVQINIPLSDQTGVRAADVRAGWLTTAWDRFRRYRSIASCT